MTTDMKQTGVPSATRGRMQLTKPIQVNNAGKNLASGTPTLNNFNNRLSENYSPIMAKGEGETTTPMNTVPQVGGQAPFSEAVISDLDSARRAFNKLSDSDKMSLLEEISRGTVQSRDRHIVDGNVVIPAKGEVVPRRW